MENWKSILLPGVLAGVLWGWSVMLVNSLTGVFIFEGSFLHSAVSFTVGGCLFGAVAGGLLALFGGFVPLRSQIAKAIIVSMSLWLLLRGAGVVLSMLEPVRYHVSIPESMQGFALALMLGLILGLLSRGEVLKTSG